MEWNRALALRRRMALRLPDVVRSASSQALASADLDDALRLQRGTQHSLYGYA